MAKIDLNSDRIEKCIICGSYYDTDDFTECPICNGEVMLELQKDEDDEEDEEN